MESDQKEIVRYKCQGCDTIYKIHPGKCPGCDATQFTIIGGKLPDLTPAQMQSNIAEYQERQRMNNLEFMHQYQVEKLAISDLSDEQLVAFRTEKLKNIERERMQIQAAEHLLAERGKRIKSAQKAADMEYIAPANVQAEQMEKKLSRTGKSAAEIEAIKNAAKIDFSDI